MGEESSFNKQNKWKKAENMQAIMHLKYIFFYGFRINMYLYTV